MTKITTLQQLKDITPIERKVRVIGNTRDTKDEEMNDLIGKDVEVDTVDYDDNTISVWDENKEKYYWFNHADISPLFPPFDWKYAFGDVVEVEGWDDEHTVIGWTYSDDGFYLRVIRNGNIKNIYAIPETTTITLIGKAGQPTLPPETELFGKTYDTDKLLERLKGLEPIK